MPPGRPRKRASKETFGAQCCDRPNMHLVQRLFHEDGPVVKCDAGHRARYFVVPAPQSKKETFQVTRAELKTLSSLPTGAPKRGGRPRNMPPEKRVLLPHENATVSRCSDGRDAGESPSAEVASLSTSGTWVKGAALDAALAQVCSVTTTARAQTTRRCARLSCLHFQRLYMGQKRYDYDAVRRWTRARKSREGLDVFAHDVLFVPVNHGNTHWALAVVDFAASTIAYLDSMLPGRVRARQSRAQPVFDNLKRFLEDEWRDKGKKRRAPVITRTVIVEDAPQQANADDCGVFVLAFAEAIANGRPVTRTALQEHIPYHRARFAAEVGGSSIS